MKCGKKTTSGRKCKNSVNCQFHNKRGGGLDKLPNEILHNISKRLPKNTANALAQMSRTQRKQINDPYRIRLRIQDMDLTYEESTELFSKSVEIGDFPSIKILIQNYTYDLNFQIQNASYYGHKKIVEFLIEQAEKNNVDVDYNWGMASSARGGHKVLIDFFRYKGANDLNFALDYAALGGNLSIVTYLIQLGATNLKSAIDHAKSNGQLHIVTYLMQRQIQLNPRIRPRTPNFRLPLPNRYR